MLIKKILITMLCFMVMLTVGPSFVFAETIPTSVTESDTESASNPDEITGADSEESDEADTDDEAGVTPDSLLYPLERMLESVQLTLTFSDEGKAELLIEFANERLAEAEIMTEKNQQDLVDKVLKAYTKTIKKANLRLRKMIEQEESSLEDEDNSSPEGDEESGTEDGEDSTADQNQDNAGETEDEAVTGETEKNNRINRLIEKIEIVQSDADKIAIKITSNLTEEQAEIVQKVIKAEVQNTIALKAAFIAKRNYVESVKEFAAAKKELGQARRTGDEASIQAALEKVEQAKENKDLMKNLSKDVRELKKEVSKENRQIIKEQREIAKEYKKNKREQVRSNDECKVNQADNDDEADDEDDNDRTCLNNSKDRTDYWEHKDIRKEIRDKSKEIIKNPKDQNNRKDNRSNGKAGR